MGGSPSFKLQWKSSGQTLAAVSSSGGTLLSSKVTHIRPNFNVYRSYQQQKLFCELEHPTYQTHRHTFVYLILRQENF